jgi:hypothetical protein
MFFIVLRTDDCPIPLVDGAYQLRMFSSSEQAAEVAEKTLLGKAYGYEIFELGDEC